MKRSRANNPTLRLVPLGNPLAEPPTGCWLVAARSGYTHHGIYVGGGRVVHYAGLSRGWTRGPVGIVSLAEFSLGRNLWAKCTPTSRYVGMQAAERALSRLGENDYQIMTNNCEHFCAWCVDGQSRSRQVERWFAWPPATALAIITWLAEVFMVTGMIRAMKRGFGELADPSSDHRIA